MKRLLVVFIMMGVLMTGVVCAHSAFEDVEYTNYEEAATVLYGLGIMKGETKDQFAPEKKISKEELVAYLSKIFDEDTMERYAIEEGITNRTVTYLDVMTACVNGLGYKSVMKSLRKYTERILY